MSWKITFYNTKVESQTLSFPPGILAIDFHILNYTGGEALASLGGTKVPLPEE